jgi:hypothetical protein
MKLAFFLSTTLAACTLAAIASADPLGVGSDATIEKILTAQQGKVVTLKIAGSEELTGKVKIATPEVVHLSELSGKEFFDAAVSTKSITAVIVRTR